MFRTLDIGMPNPKRYTPLPQHRGRGWSIEAPSPRERHMKPDQDWEAVWPATRTFHPASVPLPVRQGATQTKSQVHPTKWANAELMKIPNFLHLTPPVVKKQCGHLKRFCTPFPEGDVEKEFPLTQSKSTYLNASSSIRDHRARVITVKVGIDDLSADLGDDPQKRRHFEDKLIRLVGDGRYDPKDHAVTIVADSCPYSSQNADHCDYLLTALYFESLKVEPWEEGATEADRAEYVFGGDARAQHSEAIAAIMNHGETLESVEAYKERVTAALGLEPL